jgi:hypothetical protein
LAIRIVVAYQDVFMDIALNFDSELVFGTVEVQNECPDSMLAAKLRSNARILQAFPEKFLRWCRTVTELLPEGFLVQQIVDLFHGA